MPHTSLDSLTWLERSSDMKYFRGTEIFIKLKIDAGIKFYKNSNKISKSRLGVTRQKVVFRCECISLAGIENRRTAPLNICVSYQNGTARPKSNDPQQPFFFLLLALLQRAGGTFFNATFHSMGLYNNFPRMTKKKTCRYYFPTGTKKASTEPVCHFKFQVLVAYRVCPRSVFPLIQWSPFHQD
ncbi:hypothetical protein EDC94DRAFT_649326 [Helicostylum pulchrum]|nr:hypothetical protein EDC94DRAFT_649326 [Helicostylum pulchrum]